jgi:predicted esterase
VEHHLAVRKTARYHTLGTGGASVRTLWIACHGYGQLASDFICGLGALASPATLVVAPEALSRFYVNDQGGVHGPDSKVGATWMTREDRLTDIDDYVAYLDALHRHVESELLARRPERTLALGFSQGAATAARWAARAERTPTDLVFWGGGRLPAELHLDELSARGRDSRLTVWLVAGTRDQWSSPSVSEAEAARLEAHGITARVLTFEGGHRLDDATLARIAAGPAA